MSYEQSNHQIKNLLEIFSNIFKSKKKVFMESILFA